MFTSSTLQSHKKLPICLTETNSINFEVYVSNMFLVLGLWCESFTSQSLLDNYLLERHEQFQ